MNNEIKTSLVTSKSHVNPTQKLTIPRMELMTMLILSRLMNTVRNNLNLILHFKKLTVWTVSSVAYAWIKNKNKKQEVFIENRITEIRNNLKDIDLKLVGTNSILLTLFLEEAKLLSLMIMIYGFMDLIF